MGLGKTAQVLSALHPQLLPAVVVCPASVRQVWLDELAKWRPELTGAVYTSGYDAPQHLADLHVISYDLLGKVKLPRPKLLVCDEAHYLQGRDTRRTKIVTAGVGVTPTAASPRLWMLTGTPLWSRPRSLYPLLNLCAGGSIGSTHDYRAYAVRYCNGRMVRRPQRGGSWRQVFDDSGASNLDELHELLRPYMLRRLKAEVLDLPNKTRQLVPFYTGLSKAEMDLRDELDLDSLGDNGLPPGPIATAVKDTAMRKVGAAVAHLHDVLANEHKVVVFAWNIEVLDALQDALGPTYGVARIDGSVSAQDRAAAVDRFQSREGVANPPRVFLGQIAAAGTGITLTAASVAVFVQPEWTPANLLQAEDRVHRIGQDKPVLIQYLVTRDSIEETMLAKAREKLDDAAAILKESRR